MEFELNVLGKDGKYVQLEIRIGKYRLCLEYKLAIVLYKHNRLGLNHVKDDMADVRFKKNHI